MGKQEEGGREEWKWFEGENLIEPNPNPEDKT
jgi:hypothetical protein